MKLQPSTILCFNLCYRIFLLVYFLKENLPRKNEDAKPYKQWMDPISKRVILISINGLGSDFIRYNATPYLKDMVSNYGFSGIVTSPYFETNEGGLKALLTGRNGHSNPIFFTRPTCTDSILNHAKCACGMGRISRIHMKCYFEESNPLVNFHKFPQLFDLKNKTSCLYLINFDIDPVLVSDYRSRLGQIDNDIRLLANTVDTVWDDNRTTYIVTSARGSPVGDSLTVDSPVLAWGRGIAYTQDTWIMRRNDLTAMVCVLLSINFPTQLVGVVPLPLMDIPDYHRFEWTLYTIKHFETVLRVVDFTDQQMTSSELAMEQLYTRLNTIMKRLKKKSNVRRCFMFLWLILLQACWGVYLMTAYGVGQASISITLKSLLPLVVVVGSTLTFSPQHWELKILLEILIWLMLQKDSQVRQEMRKIGGKCLFTVLLLFVGVLFFGFAGSDVATPVVFAPVVLWPVLTGSTFRLNVVVLLSRLISGIVLVVLTKNRVFGEVPDPSITFFVSATFLFQFNLLYSIFKKSPGFHVKTMYLLIIITYIHVNLVNTYSFPEIQNVISIVLMFLFLSCLFLASGTLLERLMKVFLIFFIPVQMFSFRIECIFYISLVFQMFTWVFVEYHSPPSSILKFTPGIFTVNPVRHARSAQFSIRQIVFFLIYVYLSYLSVGHHPDLHSYDFYVLPKFFYRYPLFVSYFLSSVKFFLPFFVPTITFLTVSNLKAKDGEYQLVTCLWASDTISSILIVCFGFLNKVFMTDIFPGKFSYVVLQQCGNVCIMLSHLLANHLLFSSGPIFIQWKEKESKSQPPVTPEEETLITTNNAE